MLATDYRRLLDSRIKARSRGWADAHSTLRHFALINYALPKERLARYIPADRFDIPEFVIGGQKRAMLSVVPFWDADFCFPHFAPFLKFQFGQTNHRVYITDRQTGEPGVWFFGTTLGSPVVHIPRWLWQLPWHRARYRVDCHYNPARRAYERFAYDVGSAWCAARIRLRDTGQSLDVLDGFASLDELRLILTHPVAGYFRRLDGALGSYSIWHQEMMMTLGQPEQLYFSLYEQLGILSRAEMQQPHSIFLCPEIAFEVYLPPKRIGP